MGGKDRGPLTEPMFYVLMSFLKRDMCGTEITEFVARKTRDRVRLGPGRLYTLLGKFQEELDRLRACLNDAEEEI